MVEATRSQWPASGSTRSLLPLLILGLFDLSILLPISTISAQPLSSKLDSIDTFQKLGYKLVSSTTPEGNIHLHLTDMTLLYEVPITQIENTIDTLTFKLASMQYASDIETLQPETHVSNQVTFTVLKLALPLTTAKVVCETHELRALTLTDVTKDFKSPLPFIFNFQIITDSNGITCVTPLTILNEDQCLAQMLQVTGNSLGFSTTLQIKQYLLSNYDNNAVYLSLARNEYRFTNISFGSSACLGELPIQSSTDAKRLHEHFFSKLNDAYVSIFDLADAVTSRLADSIHSITAEENILSPLKVDETLLTSEILNSLPKVLPNNHPTQSEFPNFGKFFKNSLKKGQDIVLLKLKHMSSIIENLPKRHKRILLASLNQFNSATTQRLISLAKSYQGRSNNDVTITNDFLYVPEQHPGTFVNFIRTFIDNPDENILAEAFIIIHNQKTMLFQDISYILSIDYTPEHITRSQFSKIARELTSNITLTLIWLNKSSKLTQQPEHISTTAATTAITANPTTTTVRSPSRSKRSWGGFWGSVFALATQDDITKIYQHELDVDHNNIYVAQTIQNLTKTNYNLIGSLQSVSSGVKNLIDKEKTIFSQIQHIMLTETTLMGTLSSIINTVDRSTTLTAEYLSFQTQTMLLLYSVQTLQTLVGALLSNTLDVSQIPTSVIKTHMSDNLKLVLKNAEYKLIYQKDKYMLSITLPKLSKPFVKYETKTIAMRIINMWITHTPISYLAINHLGEMLEIVDIDRNCKKISTDYVCPIRLATIYKHSYDTPNGQCGQTFLDIQLHTPQEMTHASPTRSWKNCKITSANSIPHQQYMINVNILTINSMTNDTLIYNCKVSSNNKREPITIGMNFYKLDANCHYETSQLIIHNPPNTELLTLPIDTLTANVIIRQMTDINALLQESLPNINMTVFKSQLLKYNQTITTAGQTVQELSKTLKQIEKIDQIANFNPVSINFNEPLATSNWITIMFWTTMFFVIAFVTYVMYKTCPNHCIQCVTYPFHMLTNIYMYCTRALRTNTTRVQYSPTAQNEIEMFPTAPNYANTAFVTPQEFFTLNTSPLIWTIQNSAYEALTIQTTAKSANDSSLKLIYNPETEFVTDKTGNALVFVPPPPHSVIQIYENKLSSSAPPSSFTDNEGYIRHKTYMHLIFNQGSNTWTNSQTGQIIPGLPRPIQ